MLTTAGGAGLGRNKELDLKDRESEIESIRSSLQVRELELRQKDAALAAKEQELRRAAALDTRALQLEEERLRAIEAELVTRLRETDVALDALEAARRGVTG